MEKSSKSPILYYIDFLEGLFFFNRTDTYHVFKLNAFVSSAINSDRTDTYHVFKPHSTKQTRYIRLIEPTHIMYLNVLTDANNFTSSRIEPTHIMYLNSCIRLFNATVLYRTDTYHVFKLFYPF